MFLLWNKQKIHGFKPRVQSGSSAGWLGSATSAGLELFARGNRTLGSIVVLQSKIEWRTSPLRWKGHVATRWWAKFGLWIRSAQLPICWRCRNRFWSHLWQRCLKDPSTYVPFNRRLRSRPIKKVAYLKALIRYGYYRCRQKSQAAFESCFSRQIRKCKLDFSHSAFQRSYPMLFSDCIPTSRSRTAFFDELVRSGEVDLNGGAAQKSSRANALRLNLDLFLR